MIAAGLVARKARALGPHPQAVGEDQPRARLQGRDRVLRQGRPDDGPRCARLPHRRLRLHDLHRQLRPAAGARSRPRSRRAIWSSRSVLSRQPQLRGPRAPDGEGQLPRQPAARAWRTRSRARWTSTSPPSRSARTSDGKPVYLKDIWPTHDGGRGHEAQCHHARAVQAAVRQGLHGNPTWNAVPVQQERPVRVERQVAPTSRTRRTSRA